MPKNKTKLKILNAALKLAESEGFTNITRDGIAAAARVACGLVNYHYKTMDDLRDAMMRQAVSKSLLTVLAQGIVYGHPVALNAPGELKKQAMESLL